MLVLSERCQRARCSSGGVPRSAITTESNGPGQIKWKHLPPQPAVHSCVSLLEMPVSKSLVVASAMVALLAGCAGTPTVDAPVSWLTAPRGMAPNCADISGSYQTVARDSTEPSGRALAGADQFRLDALLATGWLSSTELQARAEPIVSIRATRFELGRQPLQTSATRVECTAANTLLLRFETTASGETFTNGRRVNTVELERRGSSLVAHRLIETCGRHYALISGCHQLEDWYRFEAA